MLKNEWRRKLEFLAVDETRVLENVIALVFRNITAETEDTQRVNTKMNSVFVLR